MFISIWRFPKMGVPPCIIQSWTITSYWKKHRGDWGCTGSTILRNHRYIIKIHRVYPPWPSPSHKGSTKMLCLKPGGGSGSCKLRRFTSSSRTAWHSAMLHRLKSEIYCNSFHGFSWMGYKKQPMGLFASGFFMIYKKWGIKCGLKQTTA